MGCICHNLNVVIHHASLLTIISLVQIPINLPSCNMVNQNALAVGELTSVSARSGLESRHQWDSRISVFCVEASPSPNTEIPACLPISLPSPDVFQLKYPRRGELTAVSARSGWNLGMHQ